MPAQGEVRPKRLFGESLSSSAPSRASKTCSKGLLAGTTRGDCRAESVRLETARRQAGAARPVQGEVHPKRLFDGAKKLRLSVVDGGAAASSIASLPRCMDDRYYAVYGRR